MAPKRTESAPATRPSATQKRRRPERRILVAILSRNKKLYSTRRLVEAVKSHGQRARVFDTLRCQLVVARDDHRILYEGGRSSGSGWSSRASAPRSPATASRS